MCGRITVRLSPEQLVEALKLSGIRGRLERPRYNLAPTQDVPVVLNDGAHALDLARWGLVPSWAKDRSIASKLINARSETVAEKPSFRSALKRRRCLVVADGWYEWQQDSKPKRPFLFHRVDDGPLTFAGLWEDWTDAATGEVLRTCTILTTGPGSLMAGVHDRMPVLLPEGARELWLTPEPVDAGVLLPLLVPSEDPHLVRHEVSRVVNAAVHDAPDCAAPLALAS